MKREFAQRLLLLLPCFVLTALPARGVLLVYEGFDYPDGSSLTNASFESAGNSFGWGGRWTGANVPMATNSAGSLGYTDSDGNSLFTQGGKVTVGAPGGATINAQPTRSFNLGQLIGSGNVYSGLTNEAATYWVSCLMQWIGQPTAGSATNLYVRKGNLTFRQGALTNATSAGAQLFAVGSPNAANRLGAPYDTWSTWTGADAGAGTLNAGFAAATNSLTNVTWIVMRFDLDGGTNADTVYTWFSWTNLAIEPSIATASTTNFSANEDGLNNIRLDANGGNAAGTNTVLVFDEFRLGTTYADVAPVASGGQQPNITAHPQSQSVVVSNQVTFAITATGDGPLAYQWLFNQTNLVADATNASHTIANVTTNDAGEYQCIVSNPHGAATSLVATLTVLLPVTPSISVHPQNFTNVVGFNANFSVAATGTAPLSYQWYFNNAPLPTRTNATLVFPIASTNDAGNYFVIITNLFGAATSSVATLTVVPGWPAALPAFPGADGAAKLASGGRGGIVYHVTKLDQNFSHNEAGTLRYGLTEGNFPPGVPRTIVFDVAGTFWLGRFGAERPEYDNGWDAQSTYGIPRNVTLAGQSAPGPVIIMGGVTKPSGSNVVLRNITFAPGYGMRGFNEPDKDPPTVPTPGKFPDSSIFPALEVSGQNVMLDHLTVVYASASTISYRESAANLTVQYCTVAQGQNYPQGDPQVSGGYRGFSYGSVVQSGANAKISVLNNLHAHFISSLVVVGSEVGPGSIDDFRNNVIYNWLGWAGYSAGTGRKSDNNFINNFYVAGPGGDSVSSTNIISAPGQTNIFLGDGAGDTRAYVSGNLKDTNQDGDPYDALSADGDHFLSSLQSTAYDVSIGLTLPATTSLTNVLRHTGARWWVRSYDFALGNTNAITTNDVAAYLDQRIIKETATGTGKVMAWADDPFDNNPSEGWEWRALLALRADSNTFSAPFNRPVNWDTDGDGMPDSWEIAHSLDPNTPNNNADFDNDGYTDLEEYLNDIAAWPAPGEIVFTGNTNNRYASIFNWQVSGAQVNITNLGNVTTFSLWQPSRYDTALLSNHTAIVDAAGQHAGTLRLISNATFSITNGWLNIANRLENNAGSTVAVSSPGGLRVTNSLVNAGTLRLTGNASLYVGGSFTNAGTLDIMTWNGTLPPGFVNAGTVLDRSLIRIKNAKRNGQDFEAEIDGYAGHNYQLQHRDQAVAGEWQNLGSPVPGAGVPITLVHPGGATNDVTFYRVAVFP